MNQFRIMVKPNTDSRPGFCKMEIQMVMDISYLSVSFFKICRKTDDEVMGDLASNSGTPGETRTPGARFRNQGVALPNLWRLFDLHFEILTWHL